MNKTTEKSAKSRDSNIFFINFLKLSDTHLGVLLFLSLATLDHSSHEKYTLDPFVNSLVPVYGKQEFIIRIQPFLAFDVLPKTVPFPGLEIG